MRLVVAMAGSTGVIFGIRLLEVLRELNVESHLVMSQWAERTVEVETHYTVAQVKAMASEVYKLGDMGAKISSGSFKVRGMAIAPCTMKTLAAIAAGYSDNLIHRAADVMLKEGRKVVIMARETPLNLIHVENMAKVIRAGATILPPMPAFYNHPQSLDDMVNHLVGRLLDQFDIEHDIMRRWAGMEAARRDLAAAKVAGPAEPGAPALPGQST